MGGNGVEVIFNGKIWLNKKHIETQLEHSNLPAITNKRDLMYKKCRSELQNSGKNQPCRTFLKEGFAIQIITDCRTTPAVNFKARLGFNQNDLIMTQEQSILSKVVTIFAVEEIILQRNVLGCRTDAYFPKYELAIEIDEQGHNDRDIDYEIERQKAIEKELDCEFKRTNPAKENFNIFVKIGKIQNYIAKSTKILTEESTKKYLIAEFSSKLLRLEFKSNNSIKAKCLKHVVKKTLPNL